MYALQLMFDCHPGYPMAAGDYKTEREALCASAMVRKLNRDVMSARVVHAGVIIHAQLARDLDELYHHKGIVAQHQALDLDVLRDPKLRRVQPPDVATLRRLATKEEAIMAKAKATSKKTAAKKDTPAPASKKKAAAKKDAPKAAPAAQAKPPKRDAVKKEFTPSTPEDLKDYAAQAEAAAGGKMRPGAIGKTRGAGAQSPVTKKVTQEEIDTALAKHQRQASPRSRAGRREGAIAEVPLGKSGRVTIASVAIAAIKAGQETDAVIATVKKQFPDSAISPAHVSWYRGKIKRAGG